MTALNRLASLERVRDWVGVTTNNDDLLLTRLVDEVSRFILNYLQRPTLFQYIFSDIYDGMGQCTQLLRHWPVQSVALVMVGSTIVPAASDMATSGFTLDAWDGLPPGRPQAVTLRGYEFCRGQSNVNIVYTTGFVIKNEPQTVPASGTYSVAVNAPHGSFGADQGVSYANGAPLVNVTGSPAQGQYTVSEGYYYFAVADAGASVQINYSYIPADIEHACMEIAAVRYRYKNRIGEVSKSLGGQETIAFSQKDIPDFVRTLLQPYRRVIMV